MCARHITLETYFNVKTLERIPWELVGRRRQELDFLKERKNASPASLYTELFVRRGTRGTRGIGDIKDRNDFFLFLIFRGEIQNLLLLIFSIIKKD